MLQVNNNNIIFKYILLAFFLLFATNSFANEKTYSKKEFINVNKDAVLNAAKIVILLADKDYIISSTSNSINATKSIAKYVGFDINLHINTIDLNVTQSEDSTKAILQITMQEDYFKDKRTYGKDALYKLFWERVNYILGLNHNWYSCLKYRTKLNFDGVLCNVFYNNNHTPTQKDIIKDISIKKQEIKPKKTLKLATIDMSIYDNIKLPLVDTNKTIDNNDTNISIIIPTENNDTNISIAPIIDNNDTNISIAPTIDNNDTNDTNISTIIPTENNDTNISITPTIIDNNNTKISTDNNLSGFAKEFMEADPSIFYTINLALVNNMKEAKRLVKKYNIEKETFLIPFKNKKDYVKIMYKLFDSYKKAKEFLSTLPKGLKINSPTIEGVGRKQVLYKTKDYKKSLQAYSKNKRKK